jgi:drug/metabolite transporter (DMT)-like permease
LLSLIKDVWIVRYHLLVGIPFHAGADIGFTLAFVLTSPANALLFTSLNPLWAAVLGRFFLDDRIPSHTAIALCFALCSIGIIFLPTIIGSGSDTSRDGEIGSTSTKGDIIALATGFCLASWITTVRHAGKTVGGKVNMTGGAVLSGICASLVALTAAQGQVIQEGWKFYTLVAADGVAVGGIFITLSIGPKLITGAETGLILLLETLLGPFWVFVFFGDVPPKWTLIGGALLILTLVVHECANLRFQRKKDAAKLITVESSSSEVELASLSPKKLPVLVLI